LQQVAKAITLDFVAGLGGDSGTMAITLRDVARAAGVSASAVSRAFTPGASVAPATRERIMLASNQLGFAPNRLAASLTTGRTRLVGIVADDFGNPFFLRVFDLFTAGLQARGLRPLLVNLQPGTPAKEALGMLREYAVDAAILISATLPQGFARTFRDAGLPVTHCFARANARPDVPQSGIHDAAAGRLAAATLVRRGYSRLGYLGGPEHTLPARNRFSGFQAEVLKRQGSVVAAYAPAWSFDAGRLTMQAMLQGGQCDAYFCADDVLAIGAISALRDAGLDVPGDVGVIGLNDMEMAGWAGINLTTIAQPVADIVASCIEQTEALIENPGLEADARLFPATLVERGTLRRVAG
jgi:DNA-binding LacI/PurR family transcriptional regulator